MAAPRFNPDAPLNQGTVGWWLAHPAFFGSATWPDLSGNGHDGTLTNMDPETDWVEDSPPGGFGGLDFDGVDDSVTGIDSVRSGVADGNTELTISARVTPRQFGDDKFMFDIGSYATSGIGLDFVDGTGAVEFYLVNRRLFSNTILRLGSSAVVTATWDGSVQRIFINGVEDASAATSEIILDGTTVSGELARIGRSAKTPSGNDFFDGLIHDVRLHSIAWTADQVAAYYAESLAGYPSTLGGGSRRHKLFRP